MTIITTDRELTHYLRETLGVDVTPDQASRAYVRAGARFPIMDAATLARVTRVAWADATGNQPWPFGDEAEDGDAPYLIAEEA